jgi:hypothetical protein
MVEFEAAWKILESTGLKPLMGWIILIYFLRKYILAGVGVEIKGFIKDHLSAEQERIQVETGIKDALADLGEKFEHISEGLWNNRDILNTKIMSIENLIKENMSVTKEILSYAKKRREDWIRDE